MSIENIEVQVQIVQGDYGQKALVFLWSEYIADFQGLDPAEKEALGNKIVSSIANALEG
jgi:hypothetical protein